MSTSSSVTGYEKTAPARCAPILCVFLLSVLLPNHALADWTAYQDTNSCPSQLMSRRVAAVGTFSTQSACESYISQADASDGVVCAHYSCRESGGGGSSVSGAGLPADQQEIVNALGKLIFGDPAQRKAAQQREAARQAAEATRHRAEQEHQAEASKERLLGESSGDNGSNSLHLIGVTGDSNLSLITDDSTAAAPTKNAPKKSQAFTAGYNDAAQCISQNSGSRCSVLKGDAWQACIKDYRAGYSAGQTRQNLVLKDAFNAGKHDAINGKGDKGFSDPRASAGCRTEWSEAYNRGYYSGSHKSQE